MLYYIQYLHDYTKKNIEVCEILLEMQKKSSLLIENQTNFTVTKSFGIATKR